MKQEMIDKIRELRKQGKKYRVISRELKIPLVSVIYNSSEENRQKLLQKSINYFKNLSREKKSEIYKRRKEYIRQYLNKKYQTDEKFRELKKKYQKEYNKRRKKQGID